MPYATREDLVEAAGGTDRFLQMTDLDGDGVADDAIIEKAQASAESWIHSYAQKRFAVPFVDPVPDEIVRTSAEETIYRLLRNRDMATSQEREDHHERLAWLERLAQGLVTPGFQPTPLKSTEVVADIIDRSPFDPASRDSWKGFA